MDHQTVSGPSNSAAATTKVAQDISHIGSLEKHFDQLHVSVEDMMSIRVQVDAVTEINTKKKETAAIERFPEFKFLCVNCGGKFIPVANKNDSCHFHPGMFASGIYSGKNWKGQEVADLEQWNCCLEIQPLQPGCQISRHVAVSEIIQWN
ncbi:hypothetical protein F4810DRAFT_726251 [Camillea tinctor]|nr:hypothetical protein F4810DRAFT_726251 [Camillea tinctor]